ncbi:MAG: MarR family transcriptional regulator, organic hydroperoxide resistance regulator [Solirubrobacteraceae bacterium]|nr:MarR family transcriptional regulator, organic hydroperoxide resistance regulator [Solirubrobacteraceae bacterium]
MAGVTTAKAAAKSKLAAEPKPAGAPAGGLSPQLTELGRAFRGVVRTISRLRGRDTHLQGSELSNAQFELLIELDERGELPAGELAEAARLTPATVTQMLDHLAAGGHVERVRSPTDRRVVVSRLTGQGREQIMAKRRFWQSRWQEALGDVSERDLRAATRVLQRLGTMFDEASGESGGAPSTEGVQSDSQSRG